MLRVLFMSTQQLLLLKTFYTALNQNEEEAIIIIHVRNESK